VRFDTAALQVSVTERISAAFSADLPSAKELVAPSNAAATGGPSDVTVDLKAGIVNEEDDKFSAT